MNHIYTTKSIIIKSTPFGEANKIYFILTRDLGFIRASAQGVRLDKSKLKGHLQDFTLANISFVKGKEMWRITSVETIQPALFIKNQDKLSIARNIFSLLLRLLHGEEKNEALFDCIGSFYLFLSLENLSAAQLKNLEIITVLRILYQLGYLKQSADVSPFVTDNTLSADFLSAIEEKKKIAIYEINEALEHTNL